ncbi:hypothetical protein QP671_28095, partial [Klebsiella pneumoniae]|nr:hypothetical protein [Klebsiella pneumoniae]
MSESTNPAANASEKSCANNVYPKVSVSASTQENAAAQVAPNPSFPKLEESVLQYWDANNTFRKSIEYRP